MNARRLSRQPRLKSPWSEKLRTCLFLGMLVINLAAVLAIVLRTHDPQHIALGVTLLTTLLAALP